MFLELLQKANLVTTPQRNLQVLATQIFKEKNEHHQFFHQL